jgi:hypothetical protein
MVYLASGIGKAFSMVLKGGAGGGNERNKKERKRKSNETR